jgi:hypothetical protein
MNFSSLLGLIFTVLCGFGSTQHCICVLNTVFVYSALYFLYLILIRELPLPVMLDLCSSLLYFCTQHCKFVLSTVFLYSALYFCTQFLSMNFSSLWCLISLIQAQNLVRRVVTSYRSVNVRNSIK